MWGIYKVVNGKEWQRKINWMRNTKIKEGELENRYIRYEKYKDNWNHRPKCFPANSGC